RYVGAIIVAPNDPNTVLVAAQGAGLGRGGAAGPTASASERGVFRTTNGGRTWTRVLPAEGAPAEAATDLYQDYFDPQVVYALMAPSGGARGAGGDVAPSNTGIHDGIYKSTDGGVTWQPIAAAGLPPGARITAFAVSSGTHGRRLYAVAGTGGRGASATRGLYRSDDGGEHWTFGTARLASAGGKIYADPQNPDVVYLMGTSMYRSTDGGRTV